MFRIISFLRSFYFFNNLRKKSVSNIVSFDAISCPCLSIFYYIFFILLFISLLYPLWHFGFFFICHFFQPTSFIILHFVPYNVYMPIWVVTFFKSFYSYISFLFAFISFSYNLDFPIWVVQSLCSYIFFLFVFIFPKSILLNLITFFFLWFNFFI